MTTIPFGREPRERDPLLAQAATLPREIQPERDLWPGIAARLERTGNRRWQPRWPMALAAGLAIATVSALLTGGLLQEPDGAPGPMLAGEPAAAIVPVRYGPNSGLGPDQLQARDELLRQFEARLAELGPETRATVLRNLEIIQRAADEIDAALAEDPGSGLLTGLLLNAFQQELDLYSRVVTSGGAPIRRT